MNHHDIARQCAAFLAHMEASVGELLDDMAAKAEYDEKFDLTITWNGKTLRLPMNADLHSGLERLVTDEMEADQ